MLIEALSNEHDVLVRGLAVGALGQIGEPAKNAVPALTVVLSEEAQQVRILAAQVLDHIGEPLSRLYLH